MTASPFHGVTRTLLTALIYEAFTLIELAAHASAKQRIVVSPRH
jgi:hypothetical protein